VGFWPVPPPLGFLGLVLLLGLYIPPPLGALIKNATSFLELRP
jgi:hypothetical protein